MAIKRSNIEQVITKAKETKDSLKIFDKSHIISIRKYISNPLGVSNLKRDEDLLKKLKKQ